MSQEQLASFGQRLIGRILDYLYFYLVILVVGLLFFRRTIDSVDLESNGYTAVAFLILVLLQTFYDAVGGTPLRRKYGVVIVDVNSGQPIGIPRAFLRILVAQISYVTFGLGYLWMLWDPKKQTWHDKAARTLVVKR